MLRYWASAVSRAFVASLDSIGLNIDGLVYATFVVLVGAFFVFKFYRQEFREHVRRNIILVILTGALAWVPMFLWHVFRTPYLIEQEAEGRLTEQAQQSQQTKETLEADNKRLRTDNERLQREAEQSREKAASARLQARVKAENRHGGAPTTSAPQGIAISGGAVTNPTVNNFGPPPPKLAWSQQPNSEAPDEVMVRLNLDRSLEIPAFAVTCDRPCKTKDVGLGGFQRKTLLDASDNPRIVGVLFHAPRPMGSGNPVIWTVQSLDGSPVRIVEAVILPEEYSRKLDEKAAGR